MVPQTRLGNICDHSISESRYLRSSRCQMSFPELAQTARPELRPGGRGSSNPGFTELRIRALGDLPTSLGEAQGPGS